MNDRERQTREVAGTDVWSVHQPTRYTLRDEEDDDLPPVRTRRSGWHRRTTPSVASVRREWSRGPSRRR
ncbi:hypothetical protein [Patulibacter minatonensis]|uniref:hypothetical protein n=1 Tax=Patulibacter minatonensis TaxID=298163 RepID=UPI00047D1D2C|nr:hypothetical protein [Patulibacter minatonensis]